MPGTLAGHRSSSRVDGRGCVAAPSSYSGPAPSRPRRRPLVTHRRPLPPSIQSGCRFLPTGCRLPRATFQVHRSRVTQAARSDTGCIVPLLRSTTIRRAVSPPQRSTSGSPFDTVHGKSVGGRCTALSRERSGSACRILAHVSAHAASLPAPEAYEGHAPSPRHGVAPLLLLARRSVLRLRQGTVTEFALRRIPPQFVREFFRCAQELTSPSRAAAVASLRSVDTLRPRSLAELPSLSASRDGSSRANFTVPRTVTTRILQGRQGDASHAFHCCARPHDASRGQSVRLALHGALTGAVRFRLWIHYPCQRPRCVAARPRSLRGPRAVAPLLLLALQRVLRLRQDYRPTRTSEVILPPYGEMIM